MAKRGTGSRIPPDTRGQDGSLLPRSAKEAAQRLFSKNTGKDPPALSQAGTCSESLDADPREPNVPSQQPSASVPALHVSTPPQC